MTINKIEGEIIAIAKYVQQLVNEEFARVDYQPEPESALDQHGLRNGLETIEDYLRYGENGIAFEHLLYMIQETEIVVDQEVKTRLINLTNRLNLKLADFLQRTETEQA